MGLIICKDCGTEVSDKAYTCIQCGAVLKQPKRSFIGKIFKWLFILFNIFMIIWLIGGMQSANEVEVTTQLEKDAHAVGTFLGVGMLMTFWALGDIILGLFVLFTRPKVK